MNTVAVLSSGPEGSRRLAERAFENYLAVFTISLLALIPDISLLTFGRTTLLVTASWTVWVMVRLYQAAVEASIHETRFLAVRSHVSTLIGFGLLICAAGIMAFIGRDERDVMAAAGIVLLFSTTEQAWSLLNRIAADRRDDRSRSDI